MYSYQELCTKEIMLLKTGKFQQDIEDFFYELNVVGYLEENDVYANIRDKTLNNKTITLMQELSIKTSSNLMVIVCDFVKNKYKAVMESLGLIYMKNYIFAIDLIRLLDNHVMFEYEERIQGKKLVLWGTGVLAENYILQNPQMDIHYIVDSNEKKWGEKFYGKQVRSPDDLRREYKGEFVVLCASSFVFELREQMECMGLELNKDFFFIRSHNLSEHLIKTIMDMPKGDLCFGRSLAIFIATTGDVHFCCAALLKFRQGNLFAQDIKDIESSVEARLFWLSFINRTYSFCLGNCDEFHKYNGRADKVAAISYERECKNTKQDLLKELELAVTYDVSCNLACITCRKEKILSMEGYDKARADALHKEVAKVAVHANKMLCAGGDPVYSTYVTDLIFNHFEGKQLLYITNGILFNEEYWGKLWNRYKSMGTKICLHISIDAATAEIYKRVRGGDFSVLLKNLQMISSLRKNGDLSSVCLLFVIMRENFMEMLDFVRLGQDLGVDLVCFARMINLCYTNEQYKELNVFDPLHPSYDELQTILADPLLKNEIVKYCF